MNTSKREYATIRWFDTLRGEGLVRLSNGDSVFIERSVILPESWRFELSERATDFLEKHIYSGQKVIVGITKDSHYTQVDWFLPAISTEANAYVDDL